ncbi:MAG: molybdopterin-binding/glycosyltransferase family 2 protein, partial [Pseudomonadota bacterium]
MKFGPLPLGEALGAVLAHSLSLPGRRLKKGRVLDRADLEALAAAGEAQVIAARMGPEDVPEDLAASRVAARLAAPGPISISAPFTGRVNLYAEAAGVLEIDAAAVDRLNRIDEAVTLATLAPHARVHARQMLATVKIIPYAAPEAAIAAAEALLAAGPLLRLHPFRGQRASLILTQTPGMKPSVLAKGAEAVRQRATALGLTLVETQEVPHRTGDIGEAIAQATGEIVLLLTASATSDRGDVGPAGLVAAGGELIRFGMPVDPGNLLFLGTLGPRSVVGLPGCARAPKLNGADWVLERLAAGLSVSAGEIGAMGVGGLLKEIPSRPQPRDAPEVARRPRIAALMLAAGASRRMGGADKLMTEIEGEPLIRRTACRVLASAARPVITVTAPGQRQGALAGLEVSPVENPRAAEGMGTSLAAGIRALPAEIDGVLVLLADMPDVTAAHLDRLIAAFDPSEGREIIRATDEAGRPGHPVLFGRRFFEPLAALDGDRGAREILADHPDFVTDVAIGPAALTDLDTPEAWAA